MTLDRRYPTGKFSKPNTYNEETVANHIEALRILPENLISLTKDLTDEQLDLTYREGGWNIRKVVHHIVDSHMNSYIRYKWTLTEDQPMIKAYDEKLWSSLHDYDADIRYALDMITPLHKKLVQICEGMSASDFERSYIHPESKSVVPLWVNTAIYAWHGNHHLGHIKLALDSL